MKIDDRIMVLRDLIEKDFRKIMSNSGIFNSCDFCNKDTEIVEFLDKYICKDCYKKKDTHAGYTA